MSVACVIPISSITAYFTEPRIIKKAENALASGHVSKLEFDDDLGCIRGDVQASMKNKVYRVEILLKSTEIEKCSCNCPRGLDVCHHMAALALFAHYNLSITDKACSWLRKKSVDEAVTANMCFPISKEYSPLAAPIEEKAVNELFEELSLCGPTHMKWLMSAEPGIPDDIVPDIEKLLFSMEYNLSSNKTEYLLTHLKLEERKIDEVANMTIGQFENPMWLIIRKHRLTASNFGRIIKAAKSSKFPASLFKSLTGSYNLNGIKQIQYGRNNEKYAVDKFEMQFNLKVNQTGLHLHPCGYLGASPDGLVGDNCIIEVKCPYKYRNQPLNVLKVEKKYIVHYEANSKKYIINKEHDYYHQIQGQLHILKKEKCYLVLFTQVDLVSIEIIKDEEWKSNMFFFAQFLFK